MPWESATVEEALAGWRGLVEHRQAGHACMYVSYAVQSGLLRKRALRARARAHSAGHAGVPAGFAVSNRGYVL